MKQSIILEKARNKQLKIIDVRTKEEYRQGYIPTATLLSLDDILKGHFTELPKDQLVCVYCRSGRRSKMAKKVLKKAGYQVKNIGGILSWKQEITT
jgi:rhodanese-related sulfurtransferase